MEKIKQNLKSNIRFACRMIRVQWKQYVCLLLGILVVQILFWVVTLSYDTDIANARQMAVAQYDAHMVIYGVSDAQQAQLSNTAYYHRYDEPPACEKLRIEPYTNMLGKISYHVYVTFSPHRQAVSDFEEHYLKTISGYSTLDVSYTPRYEYEFQTTHTRKSIVEYGALMLLVCAVSAFLMMILYNIRLKHQRFVYGIFGAFGADFLKMYALALCEMLLISLVVMVPSILCAFVFLSLTYASVGVDISFSAGTVFKVLLFHLLCVMVAVYFPVKQISRNTPSALIRAQNNARLVSSPKKSFSMHKKTSATVYESMSVWRFRWYYVKMIASAAAFSTLFLCGIYAGQMIKTHQENLRGEFVITSSTEIESDTIALMETIEGVDYILWSNVTPGPLRSDHLLLTKAQAGRADTNRVRSEELDDYPVATNRFAYTAFDRELIDTILREGLYDIEGDPYSVFNQENTIIISDSINNVPVFDFRVGDRVAIANYVSGRLPGGWEGMLRNEHNLLYEQIQQLQFEYTEYTIGAIIHDNRSDQEAIFGLSEEEYAKLADVPATRHCVEVYMEQDASLDTVAQVEYKLMDLVSAATAYSVQPTYAAFYQQLAQQRQLVLRVIVMSILILAVCPLIWFFSQLQFFAQREGEWNMLGMFGLTDTQLCRIHQINGVYAFLTAMDITLGISYSACWMLFRFCNFFLNAYGFGDGTKYVFRMSPPALLCCVCVSMICGYLASIVPYYSYRRRRKKGMAEESEIKKKQ